MSLASFSLDFNAIEVAQNCFEIPGFYELNFFRDP
jgi:hypothetical protein